jgi:RNA polymerase sigma factor (sigma-70 family)
MSFLLSGKLCTTPNLTIIFMDKNLLYGCLNGDIKAQKFLYEKYKNAMFVVCLRYTSSSEDAKDILQEGFIKIYRDLHQYSPEKGKFEHWIKKVFVNTCLEAIRRQKLDFQSLDTSMEIASKEESSLSTLSLQELTGLIQNLPIGYRTVFNMYVIEGYSHAEIAIELGVTESTSKTQLMKAKSMLRQKLEKSFI